MSCKIAGLDVEYKTNKDPCGGSFFGFCFVFEPFYYSFHIFHLRRRVTSKFLSRTEELIIYQHKPACTEVQLWWLFFFSTLQTYLDICSPSHIYEPLPVSTQEEMTHG